MHKSILFVLCLITVPLFSMEYGKYLEKKKKIESLPPLHQAILNRDLTQVTHLLTTTTVSPNAAFNNIRPIFFAIHECSHDNEKSSQIVRKLIEKKASINMFYSMNKKELLNPLQLAIIRGNSDLVALLIENGARVNEVNDDGYSALHYAGYYGHKNIVEQLLSVGAQRTLLTDIRNKKNFSCSF